MNSFTKAHTIQKMKLLTQAIGLILGAIILPVILIACNSERQNVIILATTTSTQDSGLLDELVPTFEQKTGYVVKTIAVGTGQALKMGQRGDADVLLVHAPAAEMVLMDSGDAIDRRLVMHNDFVIVGPPSDPAKVKGLDSPAAALAAILAGDASFVSRGDDSGTHKKELAMWQEAGLQPEGDWYLESGQGMGATLRIASEKTAYTLTDRATYLAQQHTLDLSIVLEGDPSMLNVYHSMRINPANWPSVNEPGTIAWSDFLVSEEGQDMIADFGLERFGQPLFFPDTGKQESELGAR